MHLCIISLIAVRLQVNFQSQMLYEVLHVITHASNSEETSFGMLNELCKRPFFSSLEKHSYPSEEVVGHRACRAFKYFMRAVWAGYDGTLRQNYLRTIEYAVHDNMEDYLRVGKSKLKPNLERFPEVYISCALMSYIRHAYVVH